MRIPLVSVPRLALAVVLVSILAALPARAAELAQVSARYGEVINPTDIHIWSVGIDLRAEAPPRPLTWLGDNVRYSFNLGRWSNVDLGRDRTNGTEFIDATLTWRHRPDWLHDRYHIDFGAGLSYVSNTALDDSGRDLDSRVLFLATVSFGRAFGEDRRWHAALRWRHNSNGGILGSPDQNPGLDGFLVEVGYRL